MVVYGRRDLRNNVARLCLKQSMRRSWSRSRIHQRRSSSASLAWRTPISWYADDRGADYTIIQIYMFEGRSDAAKRHLIAELFAPVGARAGISAHSIEITITETPKVNWGIRGKNAADLALNYRVEV